MTRQILFAVAGAVMILGISDTQAGQCNHAMSCTIETMLSDADWASAYEAAKVESTKGPSVGRKALKRLIGFLGIDFLLKVAACGATSDSAQEFRACVKRLVNPPPLSAMRFENRLSHRSRGVMR